MDDLLSEFLTETAESLEVIDTELVKFESSPNDRATLDNIFRLVHTIKGTCGFLALPRLEAVAHAGETLLGRFRDGKLTVTAGAVTLVLESIDRIKDLLTHLEAEAVEPEGDDTDLIGRLEAAAEGALEAEEPAQTLPAEETPEPAPQAAAGEPEEEAPPAPEGEERWDADLGRSLRPGEVSLAELEAAFQNADGPDLDQSAVEAERAAATAEPADTPEVAPTPPAAAGVPPRVSDAEETADKPREPGVAGQSIRVNVDVLENLMTMVSELVLTRNQLLQMVRNTDDSEFKAPLQRLSNITAELQEGVMQTRMQPIGNAWKKLPRIVRDCTHELGKKINLVMEGQDTELDRQVLDLIKDPLTHMVRNSCDHGIEKPEDRAMVGKPETGRLTLRAFHEGGHIIIEIADDGAGLNSDKIRRKAIERGLVTEDEAALLTEAQVHRFIFHAGFSTAAQVTSVSGRGVGMDVVRTNIEQIGGAIDLTSVEGLGTTFTIKIPLTLAIVSALIVGSGGSKFAIPQLSVVELVRVGGAAENRVEFINDTRVLRLRERLLPLVSLSEALGLEQRPNARGTAFVVVMQVGGQRFGVVVDEVFDTEEIVVKPLASKLRHIPVFSGNTILGDGSVIMIMDPNGVSQTLGRTQDEVERAEEAAEAVKAAEDDKDSFLIFRAGAPEPKAVSLSLVTRLEEVDVDQIERADGALLVQYRGALMPVAHADGFGEQRADGKQPMLVFTHGGLNAGLLVDEIVDIVHERLNIEIGSAAPGVAGTAVLKGKATEVVDVAHHLTQLIPTWFDAPSTRLNALERRVLLVDDNAFFRNMMTPLLAAAGYRVTAVAEADDVWRLRDAGAEFDAIVSAVGEDAGELAEFSAQLANDARWSGMPLVGLSPSGRAPSQVDDRLVAQFVPKGERALLVDALNTILNPKEAAA